MRAPIHRSFWRRRHVLGMAAGAAGATLIPRINIIQPALAQETISIGMVTWIGMTPYHIAQDQGFYEELGVSMDTKLFGSGTDSTAAFLADRTTISTPVTSSGVTYAVEGKDFRVILVQDLSVGGDGILAVDSIESIEDFEGKQIALETNGVSHFFLLQVLDDFGLTEEDVSLINVTPDAAAAAFQTGNVDIAVTYAPFLQQADGAREDGRIIYDSSQKPTAIADLYVVDTAYMEENPEAIEAFVRGTLKGLDFLNENRQQGLEIAAEALGTTPEDIDEQLGGVELPGVDANVEMLNDPDSDLYMLKPMQALAEFLHDKGQIESVPDLSDLLEPRFILAVQENPTP